MNPELPSILHEIHQTRLLLQREKDVLKTEVNPVHRVKRSWHTHQTAWIGGAAAVVGLLAAAIISKVRKKHAPIQTRYVVMGPPPKKSALGSVFKLAALFARPALFGWIKQRVEDQFIPRQGAPVRRSPSGAL